MRCWFSFLLFSVSLAAQSLPFRGCPSIGQHLLPAPAAGIRPAPNHLTADEARKLSYFGSEIKGGVPGPRGWRCLKLLGSSSDTLYLQPDPFPVVEGSPKLYNVNPAYGLVTSSIFGNTIGRYTVAEIVARYFPAYRQFVERVRNDNPDLPDTFVFEPFPGDRWKYLSDSVVEFETAAGEEGLGTIRGFAIDRNAGPVKGVAKASADKDGVVYVQITAVRLRPAWRHLEALLLREASR